MNKYDLGAITEEYVQAFYEKGRELDDSLPPYSELSGIEKYVAKETVLPAVTIMTPIFDRHIRESILQEVKKSMSAAIEMGLDPLAALEMI